MTKSSVTVESPAEGWTIFVGTEVERFLRIFLSGIHKIYVSVGCRRMEKWK